MLIEIGARVVGHCEAQDLNDKLFLYSMDVAIYHACERLANQSDLGEREKWS